MSFEGAAGYVCAASIFDGDEIVAWRRGAVGELIALVDLAATQLYLRWTVDRHRQRAGPGVHRVDNEPTQLPCTCNHPSSAINEAVTGSRAETYAGCVGALLTNHKYINVRKKERTERHMDGRQTNSILSRISQLFLRSFHSSQL